MWSLTSNLTCKITMKRDEKDKFLGEFADMIAYLMAKEKADFSSLKSLGFEVNDLVIREAKARDIHRQIVTGQEADKKKEEYISNLCMMCPEFYQLVKRIDPGYFSVEKRDKLLPEEILTAHDWKLIYNFLKAVMK